MDLGLKFDGQQFAYKDINFHHTDILCMSDDEFNSAVEGATERKKQLGGTMENSATPDFLTGKDEMSGNVLEELQAKVDKFLSVSAEVEDAEAALKELKKVKNRFSEEEIPNLLKQYGLSEIRLESKQKVIVTEDLSVSISNNFAFHKFLRERKHDDIIKSTFSFGKLSHDDYTKVADAIDTTGLDFEATDKVEAPTRKKYFKELIGMGESAPEMTLAELPEWAKAFVIKKTKIK